MRGHYNLPPRVRHPFSTSPIVLPPIITPPIIIPFEGEESLINDTDTESEKSFINMGSGGVLALAGDAGDSLASFLGLIDGTGVIRYWEDSISNWADIIGATEGEDYVISTEPGFSVLTVLAIPKPDTDGDGFWDGEDDCPFTEPNEAVDEGGCSLAQICPCDGGDESWQNHGEYVRCVMEVAGMFLDDGLITREDRNAAVKEAAKSDCGK